MDDDTERVLDLIKTGGEGRASVYSSDYRQDYDNDSSTDDEAIDDNSSDDEDNFTSKYGNIVTKTSRKGKVKITDTEMDSVVAAEERDANISDEDDFEADMEKEMQERLLAAEKVAGLDKSPTESFPLPEEEEMDRNEESLVNQDEKYSDIYFDSDEEESGERKMKTNDELFYDPDKDDEDQNWVNDVRRSYTGQGSTIPTIPTPAPKPLPSSDAVLNCPACFTVVCLDCQRHEVYQSQYRAMFVINCSVLTDQKLRFPVKKNNKRSKIKTPVLDPSEEFHPVKCDQCKTEIAMYDTDEVYHFFNVVASHT